ncbi:hypothetical protein D3C81_417590 [compost metagenome]
MTETVGKAAGLEKPNFSVVSSLVMTAEAFISLPVADNVKISKIFSAASGYFL